MNARNAGKGLKLGKTAGDGGVDGGEGRRGIRGILQAQLDINLCCRKAIKVKQILTLSEFQVFIDSFDFRYKNFEDIWTTKA